MEMQEIIKKPTISFETLPPIILRYINTFLTLEERNNWVKSSRVFASKLNWLATATEEEKKTLTALLQKLTPYKNLLQQSQLPGILADHGISFALKIEVLQKFENHLDKVKKELDGLFADEEKSKELLQFILPWFYKEESLKIPKNDYEAFNKFVKEHRCKSHLYKRALQTLLTISCCAVNQHIEKQISTTITALIRQNRRSNDRSNDVETFINLIRVAITFTLSAINPQTLFEKDSEQRFPSKQEQFVAFKTKILYQISGAFLFQKQVDLPLVLLFSDDTIVNLYRKDIAQHLEKETCFDDIFKNKVLKSWYKADFEQHNGDEYKKAIYQSALLGAVKRLVTIAASLKKKQITLLPEYKEFIIDFFKKATGKDKWEIETGNIFRKINIREEALQVILLISEQLTAEQKKDLLRVMSQTERDKAGPGFLLLEKSALTFNPKEYNKLQSLLNLGLPSAECFEEYIDLRYENLFADCPCLQPDQIFVIDNGQMCWQNGIGKAIFQKILTALVQQDDKKYYWNAVKNMVKQYGFNGPIFELLAEQAETCITVDQQALLTQMWAWYQDYQTQELKHIRVSTLTPELPFDISVDAQTIKELLQVPFDINNKNCLRLLKNCFRKIEAKFFDFYQSKQNNAELSKRFSACLEEFLMSDKIPADCSNLVAWDYEPKQLQQLGISPKAIALLMAYRYLGTINKEIKALASEQDIGFVTEWYNEKQDKLKENKKNFIVKCVQALKKGQEPEVTAAEQLLIERRTKTVYLLIKAVLNPNINNQDEQQNSNNDQHDQNKCVIC